MPVREGARKPFVQISLKPGDQIDPHWPFQALSGNAIVAEPPSNTSVASRHQLASLMVDPQNERFAQVVVNRVWKRYLGRGLVEPAHDWSEAEVLAPGIAEVSVTAVPRERLRPQASGAFDLFVACVSTQARPRGGRVRRRARRLVGGSGSEAAERRAVGGFAPRGGGQEPRLRGAESQPLGRPSSEAVCEYGDAAARLGDDRAVERAGPSVAGVAEGPGVGGRFDDVRLAPSAARPGHGAGRRAFADADPDARERPDGGPGLRGSPTTAVSPGWLSKIGRWASWCVRPICGCCRAHPRRAKRTSSSITCNRRTATAECPGGRCRTSICQRRRTRGVSWANHMSEESNLIRMEEERTVRMGDEPTAALQPAFRERYEDVVWTLANSPEFKIIP